MDKDDALQDLWNAHCGILLKRGVDFPSVLKEWATQQEERLASPGARSDFEELRLNGCVPEILAILVALLRSSPTLQEFWTKVYGSPGDRRRLSKQLEKTAKLVEALFSFTIGLEDDEYVSKFEQMGRITPLQLVSQMKLYASTLALLNRLPRDTQAKSLAELGKFLLTAYVRLATVRFHDRNVSGLIAEVIGPSDYNEVAHRMWRSRNFGRMSAHLHTLSELLSDIHALARTGT